MADTPPSTDPAVPWDPAELQGRNCGTCACYFESVNAENPTQRQGFCRRSPAQLTKMRTMEVRTDVKGNPVMKDGKPVMQPADLVGFLFAAAQKSGTCFDGWRPKSALPGDTLGERIARQSGPAFLKLLEQLPPELRAVMQAIVGPSNIPSTELTDASQKTN